MSRIWEAKYREAPENFRRYPNEEMVRFLGRTYFRTTSPSERAAIRVLEVGCGNAANLWVIAKEGFAAYGMDISPQALELARLTLRKWGVRADCRLGDARALPYAPSFFDVVIDVGTLSCLTFTELGSAYAEIWRVLKEGGLFFSYHFGRDTWDFDHGGGALIDRHTIDNTPNPEAIFPDLGTLSMLEPGDVEELLDTLSFRDLNIETVIKTYGGRSKHLQYLVITCRK